VDSHAVVEEEVIEVHPKESVASDAVGDVEEEVIVVTGVVVASEITRRKEEPGFPSPSLAVS